MQAFGLTLKTALPMAVALLAFGCSESRSGAVSKADTTNGAKASSEATHKLGAEPEVAYADSYQPDDFDPDERITKTEEEWRAQLDPLQYRVAREDGTERAFTGPYWDNKKVGTYECVGCGLDLFRSETKFKSGTGWPSFWTPVALVRILAETDSSYGMTRTEVSCQRCNTHLGHVFEDGPDPTGLRYCINSVSLQFVEDK